MINLEFSDIKGVIYRDDALFLVKSNPNRQIDILKNKLLKFFKWLGLTVSILMEHNSVNFLNPNLNLATSPYELQTKPNTNLTYI